MADQADYLLRDLLNLPEKQRIEVLEKLREDLGATAPLSKLDAQVERRKRVIETFNRVAEHLGKETDQEKLALKMREWDSVASETRDGMSAKSAAKTYRSWEMVKQAAVEHYLPLNLYQRQLRKQVATQNRRLARLTEGLYEWVATKPIKTTTTAYETWRNERNTQLEDGERPFMSYAQIIHTWPAKKWREIVAEAKAGTIDLSALNPEVDDDDAGGADEDVVPPLEVEVSGPDKWRFDTELLARRLHQARMHFGESPTVFARRCGMHASTIRDLEKATIPLVAFQTVTKIAQAVGVPTEYFLTDDGLKGLPKPKSAKKPG